MLIEGETIGVPFEGMFRVERTIVASPHKEAELYRAENLCDPETPAALKVFKPNCDDAAVDQEIGLTRVLSHLSNSITYLSSGDTPSAFGLDVPFLALEYMDDGRLWPVSGETDTLPTPEESIDRLVVLRGVVGVLQVLHEMGFAHCDVHPGNILRNKTGEGVLADYGAAKRFGTYGPGLVKSSPGFTPLEAFYGEVSSAHDVFALSAIAYWAVTNRLPYIKNSFDTYVSQLRFKDLTPTAPDEINPNVTKDMGRLIMLGFGHVIMRPNLTYFDNVLETQIAVMQDIRQKQVELPLAA